METLPVLPAELVLSHLNVKDLLACSLVCKNWRTAVNIDHMWKKICYKQSNTVTINYITTVPCRSDSKYHDPVSTCETLEPLCYWRLIYSRLQHLKHCWLTANHETYSVTDLAYNHFDLKIDNDMLVANISDNQCEVWNINRVPYRLQTIVCALKNARCKCMIHVSDNRLVIVQDTVLQIYLRDEKQFKLLFRRLFNKPDEESNSIPESATIDEWYNEVVQCRPTHLQTYHVGKFFIGLAQNGSFENASFHIWDTTKGTKLKEELVRKTCTEFENLVHNVKFCQSKINISKILVCIQYLRQTGNYGDNTFYTVIHIYDLLSLKCKKIKVLNPHVPWIYFEDSIIITIGHTQSKLSIFDSCSGERLVSKRYEEIINPDSVQVQGSLLGFVTGGDLVILNLKDFDLVFTTAIVKFSSNLFGFDFIFLNWNLILISQWDKVNKIEVWSLEEKRLLSTLKTTGLMFPCNNYAKFFVWNEMVTTIYMLEFW